MRVEKWNINARGSVIRVIASLKFSPDVIRVSRLFARIKMPRIHT